MNNGPITQTPTQIDTYTARPEHFTVRRYHDPMPEPFHGQGRNDAEAVKLAGTAQPGLAASRRERERGGTAAHEVRGRREVTVSGAD